MRAYRTHRGVKITRVKDPVCGSSFKILKDGRLVSAKTEYDISYTYAGSYNYSTIEECKDSIDRVYESINPISVLERKDFLQVINTK
jgi:hypothetical protein